MPRPPLGRSLRSGSFRRSTTWKSPAKTVPECAAAATGVTFVTIYFDRMPYGLGTSLYLSLGWIAGISVIAAWRRRGLGYIRPIVAGGVA